MKTSRTIALLILIALAGWGAGRQQDRLLALRRSLHISQADPLENAPPLVAFTTVALGGFRGILADLLWMRATRLQEEGKYFELVQLSDWITKLEPRFTAVWAFHGWNLAYNVSVLFNDPVDRWRWVRQGLSLLRDEGLLYNPGEPRLLHEIGWIFQHKISGTSDDANHYYKMAWAGEMARLFDGPAPDYEALALVPQDVAALRRDQPATAALAQRLEAAGQPPYEASLLSTNLPPPVRDLLAADPATPDLLAFVRKHEMLHAYQLDPALMRQVDERYGPLDWRLPQAHAIYWAWKSRQVSTGFNLVAADRMIFQSMADAYRQGTLFIDTTRNLYVPSPNLHMIPRVDEAYENALQAHPDQDSMKTGHGNFLRDAIVTLFTYQRNAEARTYFKKLRQLYPSEENRADFETFVFNAVRQDLARDMASASDQEALTLVEGTLFQAYYWQLLGDRERAAGYDQMGRLCWQQYMSHRTDEQQKGRVGLPPLEEIRQSAMAKVRQVLSAAPGS